MPPKGSSRGPDGKWNVPSDGIRCVPSSPVLQAATPGSKKRGSPSSGAGTPSPPPLQAKRPRTATSTKGSPKLSAEDAASVDVPKARKELNDYVKQLAKTVDDDWHDSYEETDEMLREWLEDCAGRVAGVLSVGVSHGAGFEKCNEILKVVADTWSNIQAISFRGCPEESLQQGEAVQLDLLLDSGDTLEICSAVELVAYAWPLLLARAAGGSTADDALLFRMIKDARDHGVKQPQVAAPDERIPGALIEVVRRGRARVAQLVARREAWDTLPTTKKVHRMRGAIDRRFDGPRHRRTRDPAMFEDCLM